MSEGYTWETRCEYPRGIERFVVVTSSKDQAYRFAKAFERDGFFNIVVHRVEAKDTDPTIQKR